MKKSDDGKLLLEMSLGQLLRRASSKASDLLTFNQSSGSSRILDGEIIYSKNNVCVHPSDVLRVLGEHHPGMIQATEYFFVSWLRCLRCLEVTIKLQCKVINGKNYI